MYPISNTYITTGVRKYTFVKNYLKEIFIEIKCALKQNSRCINRETFMCNTLNGLDEVILCSFKISSENHLSLEIPKLCHLSPSTRQGH